MAHHHDDHDHPHSHDHDHDNNHRHDHHHHHTHDHDHGKNEGHHPAHGHHHDDDHLHAAEKQTPQQHTHTQSPMTFEEQLKTLFAHWIRHNDSHAGTYADWAKKARDKGLEPTAVLLDEIARMTGDLTRKIEEAAQSVK